MKKIILINKKIGETPLEALERVRIEKGISKEVPMTYAGRLDPMAEGLLLILVGEECKKKQEYLDLPKVYETEILFGFESDTSDVLGISKEKECHFFSQNEIEEKSKNFIGKFTQTYPSYSSKTVSGKPLFQYARDGEEVEMPKREVEVFGIEILGEEKKMSQTILSEIEEKISKVKGDFRQEKILEEWKNVLKNQKEFQIWKFRISCGSGFYVRKFADDLGKALGTGALAYSIKRIKVGEFEL